jgi:phosphoribosylglycinamide formyltransferase-1
VALRIAVLLSGSGSSLENLIDRIGKGTLDAEIVCVIASRGDAFGLQRARRHGIPAHAVARRAYEDAGAFNDALHEVLDSADPELIVLAGFLSKLELRSYAGRVMNIHPALIPAFSGQGFYGARVHKSVLEAGVKLTGVTVHFCDEEYDHGPIILQDSVPVLDDDTQDSLAERVLALEHELYPRAIQLFAQGRLRVEGRRVRVLPQKDALTTKD